MKAILRLAPLLLLCACQHTPPTSPGRGDAGAFIVQLAREFGDRKPLTDDLPAIDAPWHYEVTDMVVVVHLPASSFPSVERVLRLAFGPPTMGPSPTTDGGLMGIYRRTAKGGGILFSHNIEETEVGIVMPLSREESLEMLDQIFQSEEFRRVRDCRVGGGEPPVRIYVVDD